MKRTEKKNNAPLKSVPATTLSTVAGAGTTTLPDLVGNDGKKRFDP